MCVDRKPSGLPEEQKGECCLEKVGHVMSPSYFSHHGPVLTCHSGHPRSCFQGSCISSCSHSAKQLKGLGLGVGGGGCVLL